jgi:hypothetical protein
MTGRKPSQVIGRSIASVIVGFLVVAVLSLGTDEILHLAGVYPPWGQPNSDAVLMMATAYRVLYSIAGAYVTARLAPEGPMRLALIGGAIGLALSVAGAAATWNRGLGGHWYSITIAAIAMPCAWLGGNLRLRQLRAESAR